VEELTIRHRVSTKMPSVTLCKSPGIKSRIPFTLEHWLLGISYICPNQTEDYYEDCLKGQMEDVSDNLIFPKSRRKRLTFEKRFGMYFMLLKYHFNQRIVNLFGGQCLTYEVQEEVQATMSDTVIIPFKADSVKHSTLKLSKNSIQTFKGSVMANIHEDQQYVGGMVVAPSFLPQYYFPFQPEGSEWLDIILKARKKSRMRTEERPCLKDRIKMTECIESSLQEKMGCRPPWSTLVKVDVVTRSLLK